MKKQIRAISILILAGIILAACGGKPEPTPTPEPPTPEPVIMEEEPQADPMVTCSAHIQLPLEPAYPLIYCEDFENPETSLMAGGEFEDKALDVRAEIYNGRFTTRMDVNQNTDFWLSTPVENARDFVFQISGKMPSHSGHPYHKWGLLLKKDPDEDLYYFFTIDNNSLYYFKMVRGDKETNLINGRKSEDINPLEEVNTLTVVTEGDKFSFFINGEFQEEFRDNRIQSGDLGLYFEVGENAILDWEFDNLVVYAN